MKTYPATELKSYAEPVTPKDMKEGRVYFAVQFLDTDLLVPVLEPFIFIGWNLDGSDADLRFFQTLNRWWRACATPHVGPSHSISKRTAQMTANTFSSSNTRWKG